MSHALLTALLWALAALAFAAAGRRVGALAVNLLRIPVALVLLGILHVQHFGTLRPAQLDVTRAWWLGLSGVVGLAIGDLFYFHALALLGARIGALLLSTWPVMSAALAAGLLGERLGFEDGAGIAVTLLGVGIVLMDRLPPARLVAPSTQRQRVLAVIGGLLGACAQAAGLVMSKKGMNVGAGPPVDPLTATLTRMVAALAAIWLIAAVTGRLRAARGAVRDRNAMALLSAGALFGPTLGVWFSLIAVNSTRVGVAATLMGTVPVMMLPLAWLLQREPLSPRAIAGTLIAFAGTAILFLTV